MINPIKYKTDTIKYMINATKHKINPISVNQSK